MSRVYETLAAMAEPKYRAFASSLLPGVDNLLGVRLPLLRKMAAQLARAEDWRDFLAEPGDTFEETMLRGMVLGRARAPLDEILDLTRVFLPQIDNWSVCDSTCAGYLHAKRHPDEIFAFGCGCLDNPREFTVRFGAVLLLDHFLTPAYAAEAIDRLAAVSHEGYYVKMAVGWALSVGFVRFPDRVYPILESGRLDTATHNKTIQKIIESHRVGPEDKQRIRKLRRKG